MMAAAPLHFVLLLLSIKKTWPIRWFQDQGDQWPTWLLILPFENLRTKLHTLLWQPNHRPDRRVTAISLRVVVKLKHSHDALIYLLWFNASKLMTVFIEEQID